ncbi:hypothetical protein FHS16_001804 [Paenibacillus endophyticus]|uniref:Uncharacterized protein n=1 Tax=Paenibacillus endophyticus TaxID=1294268 RepID=A0A7W5C5Y1_9BACL|nr:hypothetical protein [Paenibacillus endophyticus]MBB3151758.1 hypothetical protein [Paenibacillus endophyticus]
MVHPFIIEPQTYTEFENDAEQIEKCKEWGLLSEKAAKTKMFTYKGHGSQLSCSIIGFADKMTAVVAFDNGQKHCIHPSYLKEMQAANYGSKAAVLTEEAANQEAVAEELSAAPEIAELEAMEVEATPAVQVEETELQPVKVKAPPKEKAKKEKKAKLELPEEKVKMTATVKQFTTVPNNFSDTEDEVVIYEAVSIEDPAIAIEDAWSSHSATLKKFELEIGDIIHFEGKIVAKKLTKHPIPYKINNPAKIQKNKPE